MKKVLLVGVLLMVVACNGESKKIQNDPLNVVVTESNAEQIYNAVFEDAGLPEYVTEWEQIRITGSFDKPEAEERPWVALEQGKTVQQMIDEIRRVNKEFEEQQNKEEQANLEKKQRETQLVIGTDSIGFQDGSSIGVVGMRKANRIDEQDNSVLVKDAKPGFVFYIFEYLVENKSDNPTDLNPLLFQPTLTDDDGNRYSFDFEASVSLAKWAEPAPIIPGGKARFEVAIEAPADIVKSKLMPGMLPGIERYAYLVK